MMNQEPIQEFIYRSIREKISTRYRELQNEHKAVLKFQFVTKFDFYRCAQLLDEISRKIFRIEEYLEIPYIVSGPYNQYIEGEKEEYYDRTLDSEKFLLILEHHKLNNLDPKAILEHNLVQNSIEQNALDDFKSTIFNHFAKMKNKFSDEYQQYLRTPEVNESKFNSGENQISQEKLLWKGSGETLIYVINGLHNLGYLEFPKKEGSHNIDTDKVVDQIKGSFDFKKIKTGTIKEYLENKSERKIESMQVKVIDRLKCFFGDRPNFAPNKLNESKLFFLCSKVKPVLE